MYFDWPHLDRCCFCMPLRKGVLIFGYANIIFCAFTIGFNSYIIHNYSGDDSSLRTMMYFPAELLIVMNVVEVIFNAILIYGAHMKAAKYIRYFYYFAIVWTGATTLTQLIDPIGTGMSSLILEGFVFAFAFICMQLYLITLVRSLLKNMETSGPHGYENQLHQIVNGDVKENTGVYNNTTTPASV